MEHSKPVLVVGATGFLGMEICRQLSASHKTVKALVRLSSDPEKVKALENLGIKTITGDIKDRASLDEAFKNVEQVISTASSTLSKVTGDSIETVDHLGQLNVIDAAQKAGVKKFVFISFPESPEQFPLQDAKRSVEEALIKSGMDYTILRPTFFMEIWLGPYLGFDIRNHKATVYGHGVNKVSWISLKDVARFAVLSVDNRKTENKIYELGGPEALSPLEVIKLAENLSASSFELQYVPEDVIRNQKNKSEFPLEQSFSALMLTLARGGEIDMLEVLKIMPVQLTSVDEYIHEVVSAQLEHAL
jgi:Predicted nucleoside-diphosphate-sugar epimerases